MNTKDEILVRLRERVNIYRDSPAVVVTYIDLAQTLELLEQIIIGDVKIDGFCKDKKD